MANIGALPSYEGLRCAVAGTIRGRAADREVVRRAFQYSAATDLAASLRIQSAVPSESKRLLLWFSRRPRSVETLVVG